jgi:hypothetical protein
MKVTLNLFEEDLKELYAIAKNKEINISEDLKIAIEETWDAVYNTKINKILNKIDYDECNFLFDMLSEIRFKYRITNESADFLSFIEHLEEVIDNTKFVAV